MYYGIFVRYKIHGTWYIMYHGTICTMVFSHGTYYTTVKGTMVLSHGTIQILWYSMYHVSGLYHANNVTFTGPCRFDQPCVALDLTLENKDSYQKKVVLF